LKGTLSGTFVNPETHRPSSIKAVVLPKQGAAAGFFLGTNQSGTVFIGNTNQLPLIPPSP
jgi:hypothetical protein